MKINKDIQIGDTGYTLNDMVDLLNKYNNRFVVLWSGSQAITSSGTTITLSDSIDQFEYIAIDVRNGYNYNATWIISKSDFGSDRNRTFNLGDGSITDCYYIGPGAVEINKQLIITAHKSDTGTGYIERVVGIK